MPVFREWENILENRSIKARGGNYGRDIKRTNRPDL
jgi:hypothetical protein